MALESPSFTEEQWLASADPSDMISVIFPKSTERQMRLFMAACCRRVERWMAPFYRQQVDHVEQDPEGPTGFEQFSKRVSAYADNEFVRPDTTSISEWYAHQAAFRLAFAPLQEDDAAQVTWAAAAAVAVDGLAWVKDPVWEEIMRAAWRNRGYSFDDWDQDRVAAIHEVGPVELSQFPGWTTERQAQAALLRHIVGNPFRPYPVPAFWPSTVIELAQAVYDGQGDHRVLSDAVEEAGHSELAEHFRGEEWHPKGCWGLDLIRGMGR